LNFSPFASRSITKNNQQTTKCAVRTFRTARFSGVTSLTDLIRRVVQQRHKACALHMFGDNALVKRAIASVTTSQNLAALAHEALQLRSAFVVDVQGVIRTELTLLDFTGFKRLALPRIHTHRLPQGQASGTVL
jgi:hypothetical protein